MARKAGLSLVGTACVLAVLLPIVLGFLRGAAGDDWPGQGDPPEFLVQCVGHRYWMILSVVPALVCGLLLLGRPPCRWLLVTVGYLLLLIPVGVIFGCLLLLLRELYTFQPL